MAQPLKLVKPRVPSQRSPGRNPIDLSSRSGFKSGNLNPGRHRDGLSQTPSRAGRTAAPGPGCGPQFDPGLSGGRLAADSDPGPCSAARGGRGEAADI